MEYTHVPDAAITAATGVIFGVAYALLATVLMLWGGYGGFAQLFPGMQSGLVPLVCYYLIEIFLVQVVLFTAGRPSRFWALVGFLAPWALVNLITLPQFFHSPLETFLYLAVPLFAFPLNSMLESVREALWPEN